MDARRTRYIVGLAAHGAFDCLCLRTPLTQAPLPAVVGSDGELANALCAKARIALAQHIERCAADHGSRFGPGHEVWRFFEKQLPRLSAMFTGLGIVHRAVAQLSVGRAELLAPMFGKERVARYHEILGELLTMGGAYLIYDNDLGRFVRTGKATVFGPRLDQHAKSAAAESVETAANRFYSLYPAKVVAADRSTKRGVWEDLTTVVLVAFDVAPMGARRATAKQKAALTHLTAADGLFQWDEEDLRFTRGVGFRAGDARHSVQHKQLEMCSYAFELFGDLLLDPKWNCSVNPGFETPLGIYSQRHQPRAAPSSGSSSA